jgi:hypothetical protein
MLSTRKWYVFLDLGGHSMNELYYAMGEIRRAEMQQESERERLVKQGRQAQCTPLFYRRWACWLGIQMMNGGQRLVHFGNPEENYYQNSHN